MEIIRNSTPEQEIKIAADSIEAEDLKEQSLSLSIEEFTRLVAKLIPHQEEENHDS